MHTKLQVLFFHEVTISLKEFLILIYLCMLYNTLNDILHVIVWKYMMNEWMSEQMSDEI